MRKFSLLMVMLVALTGILVGQQTFPEPTTASFERGVAYAPNFGQWALRLGADAAPAATTILANQGFAVTADGITFIPFVVNERVVIGLGSTTEIATISGVSGCNTNATSPLPPVCTLTLSGGLSNQHYAKEPILSSDNGMMEAIGYMSSIGGGQVYWRADCGQVTLSTSGLTTTSTCFVPTTFFSQGVAARVTTAIATTASWALGISGSTAAFSSANSTLTLGTTALANQTAPAIVGTTNSLTAVLITGATSNATAGAVHIKVFGYTTAQPSF